MAKIKFGAIVVDGRGKLGGHVMSKNRGGNYLRTKTTPVNPQSTFQYNVRSIFAAISSAWSGLSESDRQSWEDRREEYARTNIFGDIKNPNGKALFQRLNQNLMLAGEDMVETAGSAQSVPSADVDTVVMDVNGPAFDVTTLNDLTGLKVIISATPPVSLGTSFVKNKMRVIQYSDGTTAGDIDFDTDYTARFGSVFDGDKVFVKVQTMATTGQKSPGQTFEVLVTDTA